MKRRIIIPIVLFLFSLMMVSCKKKTVSTTTKEKRITKVTIEVDTKTPTGARFSDGKFIYNVIETPDISKDDFIVTVFYQDGSRYKTDNYTLDLIRNIEGKIVNVEIRYSAEYHRTFVVDYSAENFSLGFFKDLKEVSGTEVLTFELKKEIRFNNETIYMLNLFVADGSESLAQMINSNKVQIFGAGTSYNITLPNSFVNGEYEKTEIVFKANTGYDFVYNGSRFSEFHALFTIKRKILQVPVISGSNAIEYKYDETTLKGIEQLPEIDYKNQNASMFQVFGSETNVGNHVLKIRIINDIKYTFLINDEEKTTIDQIEWSITPIKLDINEFKIVDNEHYDLETETYRYTYTGTNIIPNNNISSIVSKLVNLSEGPINASDDSQMITIYFDSTLSEYIGSDNYSYLRNFTWANGKPIRLKRYELIFYVDKAESVLPDSVKNNILLRETVYSSSLSYNSYSITSTDKTTSWFSEDTFEMLVNNGIDLSKFSIVETEPGLGVERNYVDVTYCIDPTNYKVTTLYNLLIYVAKRKVNIIKELDNTTKEFIFTKENEEDVIPTVTYKYYRLNADDTTTEVESFTSPGLYKVVASIEASGYYDFYYNNEMVTSISEIFEI